MVASRRLPTQPAKADWSSKWLTKPKSKAAKLLPLKLVRRKPPKAVAVAVVVAGTSVVVAAVMAAVAVVMIAAATMRKKVAKS